MGPYQVALLIYNITSSRPGKTEAQGQRCVTLHRSYVLAVLREPHPRGCAPALSASICGPAVPDHVVEVTGLGEHAVDRIRVSRNEVQVEHAQSLRDVFGRPVLALGSSELVPARVMQGMRSALTSFQGILSAGKTLQVLTLIMHNYACIWIDMHRGEAG